MKNDYCTMYQPIIKGRFNAMWKEKKVRNPRKALCKNPAWKCRFTDGHLSNSPEVSRLFARVRISERCAAMLAASAPKEST